MGRRTTLQRIKDTMGKTFFTCERCGEKTEHFMAHKTSTRKVCDRCIVKHNNIKTMQRRRTAKNGIHNT